MDQVGVIEHFYDTFIAKGEKMSSIDLFKSERKCMYKYCDRIIDFNIGFGRDESTIMNTFNKFSDNTKYESVLTKVIVINQLYSTRLHSNEVGNTISIREMAERIVRIWSEKNYITDVKSEGFSPVEIVNQIGRKDTLNGRSKNRAISFASKYLSFTFTDDCVPIYDSNTIRILKKIKTDSDGNVDIYENYYNKMNRLKNEYKKSEESINFKKLDAFLWIVGKAFANEKRRK